ncbi:MAG: TolC family protein [Deltaproteobacteria bacterium]|nr:TolC family protein [Deltaproteobacteria bacterium]
MAQRRRQRCSAALLFAAIAIAASAPPPPPPPPPTATGTEVTAASAAPDAAARAGQLTLNDCLRLAIENHRELAAALSRLAARRSDVGAPWRRFVPRLVFSADVDQRQEPLYGPFYSYFHPDYSVGSQALEASVGVGGESPLGTSYQLSFGNAAHFFTSYTEALNPRFETALRLTLTQRLWRGLWDFYDLDEAKAHLGREEASALEQRDAIFTEVAERWIDVARAQEIAELQRESVEMARQFEALTQKLIEGGQLSRVDLSLAAQTVADRQARLAVADADREFAADQLAAAIQLEDSAAQAGLAPIAVDAGAAWPPLVDDLVAVTRRAIGYSPTLRRLRAELEVAEVATGRAQDERRPDIRLRVDGDLSGLSGTSACRDGYLADGITPCGVPPGYAGGYPNAYPSLASGRFYGVRVGLEGTLPTFFGPYDDRVNARRHDAQAIRDQLAATEREIVWRVRRELHDLKVRAEIEAAANRAVQLAGEAQKAEEAKFRSGRSTGLAMLQTQDLVIASRLQAMEARFQLARAVVRLRLAVGDLVPEQVEPSAGKLVPAAGTAPGGTP